MEDDHKVPPKVSENTRHFLYFQSNLEYFVAFNKLEAVVEAKCVQTFLDVKMSWEAPIYIFSKMRCLCLLSLHSYCIMDLPKLVGNLDLSLYSH